MSPHRILQIFSQPFSPYKHKIFFFTFIRLEFDATHKVHVASHKQTIPMASFARTTQQRWEEPFRVDYWLPVNEDVQVREIGVWSGTHVPELSRATAVNWGHLLNGSANNFIQFIEKLPPLYFLLQFIVPPRPALTGNLMGMVGSQKQAFWF